MTLQSVRRKKTWIDHTLVAHRAIKKCQKSKNDPTRCQNKKLTKKVSKVKFEMSNVKYLDRSYIRCPWKKCHKKTVKSQKITEQSVKSK